MSFHQQLTLGYTVVVCPDCSEKFWTKADNATSGKRLQCRECFRERTGQAFAFPWARRLTSDELHDFAHFSGGKVTTYFTTPVPPIGMDICKEINQTANLKGYALINILESIKVAYPDYFAWNRGVGGPKEAEAARIRKTLSELPFIPKEKPKEEEGGTLPARALTESEMRRILKPRLRKFAGPMQNPDTFASFAKDAGIGPTTLLNFVEDRKVRGTQTKILQAIESEIRRRKWPVPKTAASVGSSHTPFSMPKDDGGQMPVPTEVRGGGKGLTADEKIRIIKQLDDPELIKKLLADL